MSNRTVPRWHLVAQCDFDQYVVVSKDLNLLHTDLDFARVFFGEKFCTSPIIHGTMIMMYLSRDIWQGYGDGATAGACKDQNFRLPVMVGDEIGFNYEELGRQPKKVGESQWDVELISMRVTAYKKVGDRELRIGGLLTEVMVPTSQTLTVMRDRLAQRAIVPVSTLQAQAAV